MNNKKGEVPKGFSGLGSLVSDIDKEMPPVPAPVQSKPEPNPPPVHEGEPISSVASSAASNTSVHSSKTKSGSSLWKFLLIGIVILFIWFGISKKEVPPPPPPPAPAAPQTSSGVPDVSAPYPSPAPTTTQSAVPSSNRAESQIPESATFTGGAQEEIPPVGDGLTLYPKQIKWCLSEKIRMSAWKDSVNNYSESSVDAFNVGVSNYNSRCSHFRYRRGTLESIKEQVEANRITLQREGFERALQNP